jgi:hypothetical protein
MVGGVVLEAKFTFGLNIPVIGAPVGMMFHTTFDAVATRKILEPTTLRNTQALLMRFFNYHFGTTQYYEYPYYYHSNRSPKI